MYGHAGGEVEAQAAYEDAMATLADEAADCHSHMQSHTSKKGKTKWTMMEMWPMLVPLPASHCIVHLPCLHATATWSAAVVLHCAVPLCAAVCHA